MVLAILMVGGGGAKKFPSFKVGGEQKVLPCLEGGGAKLMTSPIRPSHTLRCHTLAMGRSKTPAIHQNRMRCAAMHVGIFAPDVEISQSFIIRFSNGLQQCDGYIISSHVI